MRSLLVCALLILAVSAHKKNNKHNSHSTTSSTDKNEVEVSQPTSCALYMMQAIPVEDAFSSSSSSSNYGSDDQGATFYDPGQFIPNGGWFEGASQNYYFSFCTDTPSETAIEYCDSDAALCSVGNNQLGTTLATFSEMTYTPKDNYEAGVIISYNHPNPTCPNATSTYSFVLNCSKYFDPATNYSITSVDQSENGCGATIYVNTVAGCPITAERKEVKSYRPKLFTHFFLLGFAVLGGVIFLCSCCLAFCLCCKNRRAKCAAKRAGCAAGKPQQPILPQQRPAVAPRPAPVAAPRPPVTPPPQAAPQMPQMPGYFVPVPQGMSPMYPNLYQGGYLPLVPMMAQQPAIQQQHNPFVALSDNQVEQRDNQIAEDERLARLLQQQFNHQA